MSLVLGEDQRRRLEDLGRMALGDGATVFTKSLKVSHELFVEVVVTTPGEDGCRIGIAGPHIDSLVDSFCALLQKMGIRRMYRHHRKERRDRAKQALR